MSKIIDSIEDKNTYEFAVACYNDNSIEELEGVATPEDADPADCLAWDITPKQWVEAVSAAYKAKCAAEEEDSSIAGFGGGRYL